LDAIEAQADIGLDRACRQGIEKLAGVAAAFDHGDARRNLFLLIGGKQLGDAERRLRRALLVGIKQPVDPRPVMLDCEHAAVAVEDFLLDGRIELMIAPSRHDEIAGPPRAVLAIDAASAALPAPVCGVEVLKKALTSSRLSSVRKSAVSAFSRSSS
jgi:hypothetical protein